MSLEKPDRGFIAVEEVVVVLREILANTAAFGCSSLIRSLALPSIDRSLHALKHCRSTLSLSKYVHWNCNIMSTCLCSQCFPGKSRNPRTILLHLNKDRALLHQSEITHSSQAVAHLEKCILANESNFSAGPAGESLILSSHFTNLMHDIICSFEGRPHDISSRAIYGARPGQRFAIFKFINVASFLKHKVPV